MNRKAINFDLSSENLEKYYSKDRTTAYKELQKYLEKNGFIHKQYSGYVSKNTMKDYEIIKLVNNMIYEFEWLSKCVKQFDITDVGSIYDMREYIQQSSQHKQVKLDMNHDKTRNTGKRSLEQWENLVKENKHKQQQLEKNDIVKSTYMKGERYER